MGAKILLVEETAAPLTLREVRLVCYGDAVISVISFQSHLLFFLVCFNGPRGKQILGLLLLSIPLSLG